MMLNEKNFLEFAASSYKNPSCLSVDEFIDDLARVKYVKRLLNRYVRTQRIQERLIVNHLISLYNVFDIPCMTEMLFYKCEEETHPALRAFLLFLNHIPKHKNQVVDKNVSEILELL